MAKRRGNLEGSIFQRSDGRWVFESPELDWGGHKYITAKTQAEVIAKSKKWLHDHHNGMIAKDGNETVESFLNRWKDHANKEWRPSTRVTNENAIKNHLIPTLGKLKLGKLKPLDLESAYNKMAERGAKPPTIAYAHKILKQALTQAVRWELTFRNVADSVKPPKRETKRRDAWTTEDVRRFITHPEVRDHPLFALWYLVLAAGLRRGEALGLQWSDIDRKRRRLVVARQLLELPDGSLEYGPVKTESGEDRVIYLSESTMRVLSEHEARQKELRRAMPSAYQDHGLVFPLEDGRPRNPRGTTRMWGRLVRRLEFPVSVLHGTRHTAASLMNAQTRDPRLVADVLGHSDARFTMDTYVHTEDERLKLAALDLEAIKSAN